MLIPASLTVSRRLIFSLVNEKNQKLSLTLRYSSPSFVLYFQKDYIINYDCSYYYHHVIFFLPLVP